MVVNQGEVYTRTLDALRELWYRPSPSTTKRSKRQASKGMDQPTPYSTVWEQLCTIAPCGLVLIDQHMVIQFLNPVAAQLLGVDHEQVIGQPLMDVMPTWKDASFCASLPSLLDSQTTFEETDFDVPGPNGGRLRVYAAHVPGDDGGKARGVLLGIIENTEVATLERRLHRAEYQASIGKLARGIAHELNSPLDGVLRYTHLALEHLTEDSPVREYLVHIKEGLDRMVRAVKAFLEFSRQVTTPVTRVAHLNKLIDDTLLLVAHRAKFQQVQIVKQYDPTLPAVLDGGLQHAILNLVKNAFDAMPRGGTLTISTRYSEGHVDVDVEDTGSGIPDEMRSRIFEPFFSTKPIHRGSGLGLIIAKEVVERSGGTIEYSSRSGVGTTFRIHVPVAVTESETLETNGA